MTLPFLSSMNSTKKRLMWMIQPEELQDEMLSSYKKRKKTMSKTIPYYSSFFCHNLIMIVLLLLTIFASTMTVVSAQRLPSGFRDEGIISKSGASAFNFIPKKKSSTTNGVTNAND